MNEDLSVWTTFGTATISDALDSQGIEGCALGLMPIDRSVAMAGRAFTVRYRRISPTDPGTVGDYLDDVPAGAVVVLDNAGDESCTVWGDILTQMASRKGVAGTVIDGACRDTQRAVDLGYPLYSRVRTMRTGKDRVEVSDVQEPVSLSGVQVAPGDLIVGDCDGVVVVPQAVEAAVLDAAKRINEAEAQIESLLEQGHSIREARERAQYHKLQSRQSDSD
ncbi:RraA family protein [Egicoccus halophilus]|nr:RraA family protein [Egicoccus halophilus]